MPEPLCVWEGGLLHLSDPPMGLQQAPPQSIWLAGDVTEQGDTQAPEQVLDAARSASTLAAEGSPDTAEEQPGQVSPQAALSVLEQHTGMAANAAAVLAGPPGQHPVQWTCGSMQRAELLVIKTVSHRCLLAACMELNLPPGAEDAAPSAILVDTQTLQDQQCCWTTCTCCAACCC